MKEQLLRNLGYKNDFIFLEKYNAQPVYSIMISIIVDNIHSIIISYHLVQSSPFR